MGSVCDFLGLRKLRQLRPPWIHLPLVIGTEAQKVSSVLLSSAKPPWQLPWQLEALPEVHLRRRSPPPNRASSVFAFVFSPVPVCFVSFVCHALRKPEPVSSTTTSSQRERHGS